LSGRRVNKDQLNDFFALQEYCYKSGLRCIYLNAPVHNFVLLNSEKYLSEINVLKGQDAGIKYINSYRSYPDNMIGDTQEHIDSSYKDMVTEDYFNLIRDSDL